MLIAKHGKPLTFYGFKTKKVRRDCWPLGIFYITKSTKLLNSSENILDTLPQNKRLCARPSTVLTSVLQRQSVTFSWVSPNNKHTGSFPAPARWPAQTCPLKVCDIMKLHPAALHHNNTRVCCRPLQTPCLSTFRHIPTGSSGEASGSQYHVALLVFCALK